MKRIIFILILCLLVLPVNCFCASDKIYSWTDEDGVRHFSDAPTYSVGQESKGTAPFLIDRHGKKQIGHLQKIIEDDASKKMAAKPAVVQQTQPKLKSGGGQLYLNGIDLFVSFFLLVLLFIFMKLAVAFFFKKSLKFKYKKTDSIADFNGPDTDSPAFKGFEGEQIVVDLLYQLLDRKKYHFFNDLTLPVKDGTTQIDHLIVSEYGIFVVETKHMKGSIYGNPYQKTWTQWLADGKHPFQNPFRQNYKHKKCLEELLKIKTDVYFEAVVFIACATFPKGKPDHVFYPEEFIQFVKAQTKPVLSANEVDMILGVIDSTLLEPTFETDKRHRAYVKTLCDKKGLTP